MTLSIAVPATSDRVSQASTPAANQSIRLNMENRVQQIAAEGPEAIERRLQELDHEWDVERVLEANASTIILTGIALGVAVNRRYLVLPIAIAGFLLQHAIQGWCPPLPVLRHFGVRTSMEIEAERYALKALRGDFASTTNRSYTGDEKNKATVALEAVRI